MMQGSQPGSYWKKTNKKKLCFFLQFFVLSISKMGNVLRYMGHVAWGKRGINKEFFVHQDHNSLKTL